MRGSRGPHDAHARADGRPRGQDDLARGQPAKDLNEFPPDEAERDWAGCHATAVDDGAFGPAPAARHARVGGATADLDPRVRALPDREVRREIMDRDVDEQLVRLAVDLATDALHCALKLRCPSDRKTRRTGCPTARRPSAASSTHARTRIASVATMVKAGMPGVTSCPASTSRATTRPASGLVSRPSATCAARIPRVRAASSRLCSAWRSADFIALTSAWALASRSTAASCSAAWMAPVAASVSARARSVAARLAPARARSSSARARPIAAAATPSADSATARSRAASEASIVPSTLALRHDGALVDRQPDHPSGRLEGDPDLACALQHADAEHLVDDDARLDAMALRLDGPGARGRDHRDQPERSEDVGEEPGEA
jgi:hypothetical protein